MSSSSDMEELSIVEQAVSDAGNSRLVFWKFLSADDTGDNGDHHQAGIYIAPQHYQILFDTPGCRGSNQEKWVTITWQGQFQTQSCFVYCGQQTGNEYRITNFDSGFPFLQPAYTGALFLLIRLDDTHYQAWVFNTDDEIDEITANLNIDIAQNSSLLGADAVVQDDPAEKEELRMLIAPYAVDDFPDSLTISLLAQKFVMQRLQSPAALEPDRLLEMLLSADYKVFRVIEEAVCLPALKKGFTNMESFLTLADTILDRRKSRAEKTLKHQVAVIFKAFNLDTQVQTKEDQIPLAVRSTCKDGWRQILNEADQTRNQTKYLLTLQQGISSCQLQAMAQEKVQLIVPRHYIKSYPPEWREHIWSLSDFIRMMQKQIQQ